MTKKEQEKGQKKTATERPFSSAICHIFSDRQWLHESQLLTKYVHENLRGKDTTRFPNRRPRVYQWN